MRYAEVREDQLDLIVHAYMEYYNARGGTWTYEKAYRRIHQVAAMENSLVILQFDNDTPVGFLMGWYKQFDDSLGFYLEEILVFSAYQNKGYGSSLLAYLRETVKKNDCAWIELVTTTGAEHQGFYKKNGYTRSDTLTLMYLDL